MSSALPDVDAALAAVEADVTDDELAAWQAYRAVVPGMAELVRIAVPGMRLDAASGLLVLTLRLSTAITWSRGWPKVLHDGAQVEPGDDLRRGRPPAQVVDVTHQSDSDVAPVLRPHHRHAPWTGRAVVPGRSRPPTPPRTPTRPRACTAPR